MDDNTHHDDCSDSEHDGRAMDDNQHHGDYSNYSDSEHDERASDTGLLDGDGPPPDETEEISLDDLNHMGQNVSPDFYISFPADPEADFLAWYYLTKNYFSIPEASHLLRGEDPPATGSGVLSEHHTTPDGAASLPDTSSTSHDYTTASTSSMLTSDVQSVDYSGHSLLIPVGPQHHVDTSSTTQHSTDHQALASPGQADPDTHYDGASMLPQSSSERPESLQDGQDQRLRCGRDGCPYKGTFKGPYELGRHEKSVHQEGEPVKVCDCGRRFYRKDKAQDHLKFCKGPT